MNANGGMYLQRGGERVLSGSYVLTDILDVVMILFFLALTALAVLLFIRLVQRRGHVFCGPHAPWRGAGAPPHPFPEGSAPGEASGRDAKKEPVADLSNAVLILNERFAKGEITREEYLRMKEDMFRG